MNNQPKFKVGEKVITVNGIGRIRDIRLDVISGKYEYCVYHVFEYYHFIWHRESNLVLTN